MKSAATIASLVLAASSSHAATILVAHYQLGESGTVTTGTALAINDSSSLGTPSGLQNVGGSGGTFGTVSGVTTATVGVSAPGSTAYLDTSATAVAGVYSATVPIGMTTLALDNFAFGIYARAANNNNTTTGAIGNIFTLGGAATSFRLQLNTGGWTAASGGTSTLSTGGTQIGSTGTFTPNTWVHLALIRDGGVTAFYINGVQQGGTFAGAPVHDAIHLAVNPGGGTDANNFDGFLDEARVVTFDNAATTADVFAALNAVPEPSAALLGGLGACFFLLRRRRA